MLRGKVDDSAAKAAASEVTKGIDGVKSVKDELQVVPPDKRSEVTGEVKSIDASAKASELTRSVAGVRSVKNDLTYAPRSSMNK